MAYAGAYAMVGDAQLAEDVAQEAFMEAYLNLPKLREACFPGWFRRIIFKQGDRLYVATCCHDATRYRFYCASGGTQSSTIGREARDERDGAARGRCTAGTRAYRDYLVL